MEHHDNYLSSAASPGGVLRLSSSSHNLPPALRDKPPGEHTGESALRPEPLITRRILGVASAVMLLVAGAVAYFIVSDRAAARQSAEDATADARVSIDDASRRLDSLPPDSPLRVRLNDLEQWRQKLDAYARDGGSSQTIREQAERYTKSADEISNQALEALKVRDTLGKQSPAQNRFASTQPESPVHSGEAPAGSALAPDAHRSAQGGSSGRTDTPSTP